MRVLFSLLRKQHPLLIFSLALGSSLGSTPRFTRAGTPITTAMVPGWDGIYLDFR